MTGNGVPTYRVNWLVPARSAAKKLLLRAKELGIFEAVAQILLGIEHQLANNPRTHADPLFHTQTQGGLVCRRTMFSFSVHFVIFEIQRIVLIHRIDPLPPHPLAEG